MITLKMQMRRLKPPDVMQRFFNMWVREAFEAAAAWWIAERLPLHWGAGASDRYQYPDRSLRYLIKKAFVQGQTAKGRGLRRLLGRRRNARVRDTSSPFELTGQMKRAALARARGRGFATSNGARLEITVPIGFAGVRPENRGQIVKLLPAEARHMRRLIVRHVAERVGGFREWREAA